MLHPAQNVLKQRHVPFSLMDGQKSLYQLHHVKNVLLYLHLILDKNRDDEVERLLRYNIVPYIEREQIKSLKSLANDTASSLFEAFSSPLHLQIAKISKEQQESLQRHLEIINRYHSGDLVSELANDLEAFHDGPLTLLEGQDEKRKEVKDILNGLSNSTIQNALDDIQSHISFLEKHHNRSAIVLTTVSHAKSQEFETVFLLGVDKIFDKRLYVAVSRAKQRLFFVGDTNALTSSNRILGQIPKSLYTEISSTQTRMTDDKKTKRDEPTHLVYNEELKRRYFLE
jgi:superfamily I DNA/RNA helicase